MSFYNFLTWPVLLFNLSTKFRVVLYVNLLEMEHRGKEPVTSLFLTFDWLDMALQQVQLSRNVIIEHS